MRFALFFLTVAACAQQAQLDSNRTLFNVLTAINLAGYDAEIESPSNHPLRAAIRQELGARKLSTVGELRRFFAAHRKDGWTAELSQYVSFALAVDGTDQYQWRFKLEEIPPDALALEGFGALMTRFHQQAKLDELWARVQPAHDALLEPLHAPVTLALQSVAAYLRVPSTGQLGRRFFVYADLMGAPHHIQARGYADDYFVVLTPTPEPRIDQIRQAYIGFLVDPLATKFAEKVEKKKPLIDLAQAAPALPEVYKSDFLLLTTKCLVKAVDARMQPVSRREALLNEALGEGYILTPYFFEALAQYEKQESAMRLHYPDMIDGIDLVKEDKRLASVTFLAAPIDRKVRAVPPPRPPELVGVRKVLEEAEDLYRARNLEAAREKFVRAAEDARERPLQAKAYYGLARIATLQKDPELAEKLFARVLESEPEASDRAWALYYLARLAELSGESERSLKLLKEALKVEGATKALREAAEKALKQPRN
jgi:tetratricopeptide (TPR) repeat protein